MRDSVQWLGVGGGGWVGRRTLLGVVPRILALGVHLHHQLARLHQQRVVDGEGVGPCLLPEAAAAYLHEARAEQPCSVGRNLNKQKLCTSYGCVLE